MIFVSIIVSLYWSSQHHSNSETVRAMYHLLIVVVLPQKNVPPPYSCCLATSIWISSQIFRPSESSTPACVSLVRRLLAEEDNIVFDKTIKTVKVFTNTLINDWLIEETKITKNDEILSVTGWKIREKTNHHLKHIRILRSLKFDHFSQDCLKPGHLGSIF